MCTTRNPLHYISCNQYYTGRHNTVLVLAYLKMKLYEQKNEKLWTKRGSTFNDIREISFLTRSRLHTYLRKKQNLLLKNTTNSSLPGTRFSFPLFRVNLSCKSTVGSSAYKKASHFRQSQFCVHWGFHTSDQSLKEGGSSLNGGGLLVIWIPASAPPTWRSLSS